MPSADANPMSASDALISPAHPQSGRENKFLLFSDSWLTLQSYIGSALLLPITDGDFENKYGSFKQSSVIKDSVSAMRSVQQASTEFGDPRSLRRQLIDNPDILAGDAPPSEIYTHTVWLGQRIYQASGTLTSGYQEVLSLFDEMKTAKEKVDALKEYLFDQSIGPIPLADRMAKDAAALIRKLGTFEAKMNDHNQKLAHFTSASSKMRAEVNDMVGTAEQKIRDLEVQRVEAEKAWRDYTIAACTTSVGCALIGVILAPFTLGLSAIGAIGTGVGLGVKAGLCRAAYNGFCDEIQRESDENRRKIRLRSDLGDFDTQMLKVGPAMGSFVKNLQAIEGNWVLMNTALVNLSKSLQPETVSSSSLLSRAQARTVMAGWNKVGESAKDFTTQSLIDYRSIAFGDRMPEQAAA